MGSRAECRQLSAGTAALHEGACRTADIPLADFTLRTWKRAQAEGSCYGTQATREGRPRGRTRR
eukprot:13224020-Alexandrium_andersonii.AAC.1